MSTLNPRFALASATGATEKKEAVKMRPEITTIVRMRFFTIQLLYSLFGAAKLTPFLRSHEG
jgi:hypothetical protein